MRAAYLQPELAAAGNAVHAQGSKDGMEGEEERHDGHVNKEVA